MQLLLLVLGLACLPAALQAALVRGVVLDNTTGRALARTLVRLDAVAGSQGQSATIRSGSSGQFAFTAVRPGMYLLSASRSGFLRLRYGQKRWNAPGKPVVVGEDADLFLDLRMSRFGAVTGTVSDENDIGLPDQEVVAYTATRPPRIAGRARTDETGGYRIGRLEPGRYLIRSIGTELEDRSGVLSTFHKETLTVGEARVAIVSLAETAREVDIRPIFGKLYRFAGTIGGAPPGARIEVTLVSDTGRITRTTDGYGGFTFGPLPPGEYELLATLDGSAQSSAVYARFTHGRDTDNAGFMLQPPPRLNFGFRTTEGAPVDRERVGVWVRRKDLAGEGPPQRIAEARPNLHPGRWQIMLTSPPDLCPTFLSTDREMTERPDAWTEILVQRVHGVEAEFSKRPAAFSGVVVHRGEPVAAAPVYLEPLDPKTGARLADLRTAVTNARGEFQFSGLNPGPYRLLSTLDFENPDEETMAASQAKAFTLEQGESRKENLDLFGEP